MLNNTKTSKVSLSKKSITGMAFYSKQIGQPVVAWKLIFMMFEDPKGSYKHYNFGYSFDDNLFYDKNNLKKKIISKRWPKYVKLFIKNSSAYQMIKYIDTFGNFPNLNNKYFFNISPD